MNQPSTPEQDCTVTNEAGDINITDITNVHISCSTDVFSIGGTVTGLIGGNSITLQNNNTDDEVIFNDGIYAFSIQIEDEDAYSVTVLTQPNNPNQLCSVSNAGHLLMATDELGALLFNDQRFDCDVVQVALVGW